MKGVSLASTTKSEWIKFRSLPSTLWGLLTMLVLSIGLGTLIDFAIVHNHHHRTNFVFDPLTSSLVGVFFAQFVVGVIGAMIVTNEYTSASIRTTLAAVPRRTLLVMSKLVVLVSSFVVVSELIVFTSFFIGQAMFHGNYPSLSVASPGAARAVALAGLYLLLLGAMGFGLGLIFRRTPAAIVVFVVVILIVPIIVNFLPSDWNGAISRFLPGNLGGGMMSLNQATGTYPPFGCAAILLGYVTALIVLGTYLFNRRDA